RGVASDREERQAQRKREWNPRDRPAPYVLRIHASSILRRSFSSSEDDTNAAIAAFTAGTASCAAFQPAFAADRYSSLSLVPQIDGSSLFNEIRSASCCILHPGCGFHERAAP